MTTEQPPPQAPSASTITNHGLIHHHMQRYEALADLNRAIDLDPGDVFAIISRSYIYRAMKRYGKSMADTARAVRLDPDKARATIVHPS